MGLFGCSDGGEQAQEDVEDGSNAPRACADAGQSPVPLRRLTRFEVANVVFDVFGLEVDVAGRLPRDEVASGFDNQAGAQTFSELHVEGFMNLADDVARWIEDDPQRLRRIADCEPTQRECVRAIITTLGRRLQRRPLLDSEVDSLLAVYDGGAGEVGEGLSRVVAAILQSPRVLYRLERDPVEGDALASPWILASRLSFLIWGSVPDEALLDRAAAGELVTTADVEREAERMVEDERARRGIAHFYLQWLGLAELGTVEKDPRLFERWDDALRADLEREIALFIEAVLWTEDARLETMLTAPFTFANPSLQDFYGFPITDPDAEAFERVEFDAQGQRGGLLTQGAILSAHAKANQTSPIDRGKFIREKFFCTTPPPPPPDLVVEVPKLDPRRTTRERFEQHRTDPACSMCHELLDPIGLAFENFDAVGRYRETESELPIDASGFLTRTDVDGPIASVAELAAKLADSEEVRDCVVTQWFRFAFGRGAEEQDACTMDELQRGFTESDGDLRTLLVSLTQTEPFLRPAPAPQTNEDER